MASSHRPTTGSLLWRVTNKWRAAVDRAVAPLGLTHAKYSLLATLYGLQHDGTAPSQRELAEAAGMEPIYVSRLVSAIEPTGLIDRAAHPDDTRAYQVALTSKGERVMREAIAVVADLHDELLAPLGGRRSARTRALDGALQALLTAPILDKQGDQP